MRFAVLSTIYIIAGQLAASAAVPERRDIVLETIIHDESHEATDHYVPDDMLQKGGHGVEPKCQDYGHSCTYGQCCEGYSCITIIFGVGGWCW